MVDDGLISKVYSNQSEMHSNANIITLFFSLYDDGPKLWNNCWFFLLNISLCNYAAYKLMTILIINIIPILFYFIQELIIFGLEKKI